MDNEIKELKCQVVDLKKALILDFLKKNPDNFFGAVKIDNHYGWYDSKDNKSWPTHDILLELANKGMIEQSKGQGFKYTKAEHLAS